MSFDFANFRPVQTREKLQQNSIYCPPWFYMFGVYLVKVTMLL